MPRKRKARSIPFAIFAIFTILIASPLCRAQFSGAPVPTLSAFSIPQSQLIQAAELNRLLQAGGDGQPVVLQVGSHVMFEQAHIPGALYAGPGSQASGLQLLESIAAQSQKRRLIVLYCGCCPWNRCPNVGPAYKQLRELGFSNVKVLYMANNFGDDWVNKGYPIEAGH